MGNAPVVKKKYFSIKFFAKFFILFFFRTPEIFFEDKTTDIAHICRRTCTF